MVRVLSNFDIDVLMKEIAALGPQAKIISVYGLNSRHWAWVQMPEQKRKQDKESK